MSTKKPNNNIQKHVYTVEKAKEWENFRNLPRFSHKELAVIHPTPKLQVRKKIDFDRDLELQATPAKF